METIQVSDREGHTLTGDVVERANAGDADLLQVWIAEAGMRISLILYPDGTQWNRELPAAPQYYFTKYL